MSNPCCNETPCQWGEHPCERKSVKTDDGRDLMTELDNIATFLDSEKLGPSARIVEQAKMALNAAWIAAGCAAMERGEWAAERSDLRAALETLVRINDEDYAPWLVEPDSELGLAMAAARKALTTWASKQDSAPGQSGHS